MDNTKLYALTDGDMADVVSILEMWQAELGAEESLDDTLLMIRVKHALSTPVEQWEPVEDGFQSDTLVANEKIGVRRKGGKYVLLMGKTFKRWWFPLNSFWTVLPDDIRLCRKVT